MTKLNVKRKYTSAVKVKEVRLWDVNSVMNVCNKMGWYTRGCIEEYEKMLNYVIEHVHPTTRNIYTVACDILDHTSKDQGQTVSNIMCYLANDTIDIVYYIDGEEC